MSGGVIAAVLGGRRRRERAKVDHVHSADCMIVLSAGRLTRQASGTLTVKVGCPKTREAFVSTLMEPCPWSVR